MKKATLTEDKAEKTPTGGVLVGKREGQTIIHNKGSLSGYLVGKTHAEGGIKAVNKSTGQPLEMQGGEVVITAPAVSDNTKNEFNGKMMTNREILSQINVKGGGVAFAKDGMEIPKSVKHTGASYNYGGKTMTDHEIIKHITGGHLAKAMTLTQIAKKHKVSLKELQKQVDMGMKAESEHTSSKREQMKIVKDHLYENPKYYSLLKKAGLKHGGRVYRGSLVRDAKSGNTPARDLNNYNDVMDLEADGMVGAETGLFDNGGMFNTEPFLNYYFDEIAEFLKYQNNITLNKDFTFKYKGELFRVEPIVLSEKNIKEAYFSIIDSDDEEVGDIVFNPNNNKKFEANSDFFDWNNIKFYNGGDVKPYDANMEGDSADMMFVTGGGVKELVEYITMSSNSENPYENDDKIRFYNFIDFKNYIKDIYANEGITNKRLIYLCINNDDSFTEANINVSQGKNTNKNFNPFTGSFDAFFKNINDKIVARKYDWSFWSGVKSSTSTPSQTSVPNVKVLTKDELINTKIWFGNDVALKDKVVNKLIDLGIPMDSNSTNLPRGTHILIYTKDFIVYGSKKDSFDRDGQKEIFPSDLGINVGATTTSANTKFFQFTGETLTEIPDSITNFSGIIKDLPEKIRLLALQRQKDAGKTPNENLEVNEVPSEGGFRIKDTPEGDDFWIDILKGNFEPFKKIYGNYGEGLTGININTTPTSKLIDLTNTKIWIGNNPALSEKIQKRVFELGWKWNGSGKNVANQDKYFLFFEANGQIGGAYSDDMLSTFEKNSNKEIFESDLFPTSTASQTSTQSEPITQDDWVKKFTADLDKLQFGQETNELEKANALNVVDDFPQLSKDQKDLDNLKKLLPSFQQKKFAIERARIIKEIKRLHNKLTYEAFIKPNEALTDSASLFTPQGLLDYYFTQATQNPTAELEEPCGLPTPNGNNSKLPLSAYLNVRTSQFKKWFGDWEKAYETGNYVDCSKMIDPDTKEPKIYFHGVRKFVPNFGQFSNMGQGVVRPYGTFEPPTFPASFFAGEEEYAKFYGGIAENLPTPSPDYKPFIYKVFLSVKNPISLLPLDFMLSYKDFMDYIYVGYGVKVTPNQQLLSLLDNDMIKKNPMWIYVRRDIGLIEMLKDYGYDAIFQMGDIPTFLPNGQVEPDRTKHLQEVEYLTFYPSQVKSATVKKSFYFDFFNDIRFKNGGYVRI